MIVILLVIYAISAAVLLCAWAALLSRELHPERKAAAEPIQPKPTGTRVPLRAIK